jgi:hypothetical protein
MFLDSSCQYITLEALGSDHGRSGSGPGSPCKLNMLTRPVCRLKLQPTLADLASSM